MRGKLPPPASTALQLFEQLTPPDPGIVVKKVFGQPAAFVNGNMFMGVFGPDVFVRLSDPECQEAISRQGLRAFEPMAGRAMRGYAVLPPAVLKDRNASRAWVAKSFEYSQNLPPKKLKSKKG